MKKENIYKFLYIVAALLVVGFAIAFGVDAYKYNTGGYLGSAPLYAYALVDAVETVIFKSQHILRQGVLRGLRLKALLLHDQGL